MEPTFRHDRAYAGVVPGRPALPRSLLLLVHRVAVRAGLDRLALLSGLPRVFTAGLPTANSPMAQLLMDLSHANEVGASPGGTAPIRTWLENAVALLGARQEANTVRAILESLG